MFPQQRENFTFLLAGHEPPSFLCLIGVVGVFLHLKDIWGVWRFVLMCKEIWTVWRFVLMSEGIWEVWSYLRLERFEEYKGLCLCLERFDQYEVCTYVWERFEEYGGPDLTVGLHVVRVVATAEQPVRDAHYIRLHFVREVFDLLRLLVRQFVVDREDIEQQHGGHGFTVPTQRVLELLLQRVLPGFIKCSLKQFDSNISQDIFERLTPFIYPHKA